MVQKKQGGIYKPSLVLYYKKSAVSVLVGVIAGLLTVNFLWQLNMRQLVLTCLVGIIVAGLIGYLNYRSLTKRFRQLEIRRNEIIFSNASKKWTVVKEDIVDIVAGKVFGTRMYGLVYRNPSVFIGKMTDKSNNRQSLVMGMLNYFCIRKKGVSLKQVFSGKREDKILVSEKICEHNFEKKGFHGFILADYINDKEQLLVDLKKFIGKK